MPGAEDKIHQAALTEYTEHGWAGFTMDGVARRAGFGKSTLYLRWADKDALLIDAVRRRNLGVVLADTGSLRGDLTALSTSVLSDFADPEGWAGFRMMIDSASASQPLGEFTRELSGLHREAISTLFARARERAEPTPDIEPMAVTELIYGAALFFVLRHRLDHRAITEDELAGRATHIVTILLDGLG